MQTAKNMIITTLFIFLYIVQSIRAECYVSKPWPKYINKLFVWIFFLRFLSLALLYLFLLHFHVMHRLDFCFWNAYSSFFARCLNFTLLSHPQGGRNIFFISFLTHPFLLLYSNFSVIVVVANVTGDFAHILGAFVWFHRVFFSVKLRLFLRSKHIFFYIPGSCQKKTEMLTHSTYSVRFMHDPLPNEYEGSVLALCI